jgi:hypothetical protein
MGCLEATESLKAWAKGDGYAEVWVKNPGGSPRGRNVKAHRHVWEQCFGEIPDGMFVCHHCDNRSCVNPEHLFLGDHQDNMDDMVRKGRGRTSSGRGGEGNPASKLTQLQVDEIRRLCLRGVSQKSIAAKFGIHPISVSRIACGDRW